MAWKILAMIRCNDHKFDIYNICAGTLNLASKDEYVGIEYARKFGWMAVNLRRSSGEFWQV